MSHDEDRLHGYLSRLEYWETHCAKCKRFAQTLDEQGLCRECHEEYYETHCRECRETAKLVDGLCEECIKELQTIEEGE